jgi:3',5'-nucleoside bisphosphate phosphatase
MNSYRADLHIHTLLSPCADLEMTPKNIVEKAKKSGLHIIGITDHNSTKHALLVKKLAEQEGIYTLTGAEVTTREEVHCLVFFEHTSQLNQFQQFIENDIVRIPNSESNFGYQPVIDHEENIVEFVPYYLPAALRSGITQIQQVVYDLEGIYIPAHVDRPSNGIFSQLGFIPPALKYDALGLSRYGTEKDVTEHYVLQNKTTLIRNSDAHYLKQIGEIYTVFKMNEISFSEIKKALNQQDNRFCKLI